MLRKLGQHEGNPGKSFIDFSSLICTEHNAGGGEAGGEKNSNSLWKKGKKKRQDCGWLCKDGIFLWKMGLIKSEVQTKKYFTWWQNDKIPYKLQSIPCKCSLNNRCVVWEESRWGVLYSCLFSGHLASYFVLSFIVGLLFQKGKDVRMQGRNKDLNYVSWLKVKLH